MDVRKILQEGGDPNRKVVLEGIIVERDNEIVLIDCHDEENWEDAVCVHIDFDDLLYALVVQIPLQHGGKTLIYQKSRFEGFVKTITEKEVVISPEKLFVERIGKNGKFFSEVELSETMVLKGKAKFLDRKNDFYELN